MYAVDGRPSIAPERLLRASLLQVLYSVRSERLLCEQLDYNLLFRWFVGLSADERVFDDSTFSRPGPIVEADIARALFARVYARAQAEGLTSDEHFSVDGTLIDAWASQKSFRRKEGGDDENPAGVGRNAGRNFHDERRSNETHASRTDPDARLYRKSQAHPAKLCHAAQVVMENRKGPWSPLPKWCRSHRHRRAGERPHRDAGREPQKSAVRSRSVPTRPMTPTSSSSGLVSSTSPRMWHRIISGAVALPSMLARPPSANALRSASAGARRSVGCGRRNIAEPARSTFSCVYYDRLQPGAVA